MGSLIGGRFKVLGPLAEGELSTVYRARDTQTDQPIALKCLSPDLCRDTDALLRFERECRVLAKLRHPHLIGLVKMGWRGALPWLAMPLLPGQPLSEVLQPELPATASQTLAFVRQIGAALSFLHANALVHRDVKPSNVFVDAAGTLTLLDLGVAHDMQSLITRPGLRIGTVTTMAPEQIRGQPIDERTDEYAFAVVVYRMLTGRAPFRGEQQAVLRAHLTEPAPDAHAVNPAVPPGVARALRQAMAKQPSDRFPTLAALCERLELLLEAPATFPMPPPPPTSRRSR
ncbi:MAG: serine/threonine protein kinase [Myxococcaceae bacterium]|nr:serine/threonine protein kinase [Myxococcaceae bacterium]